MPRISVGTIVVAGAVLIGCHTITEELPTQPTDTKKPAGTGVLTVSIPALTLATTSPAPDPAATPAPEAPAPESTPEPDPPPAVDAGDCGEPLPPPIRKVNVYEHIRGPNRSTLDATPLVAGYEYCKEIGFKDGRNRCPVRPEGHPERGPCETYAVGLAEDTGRPGPTWTGDGSYCTDGSGCENHAENQYLLWVYSTGRYKACVQNGKCGSVDIVR